MHAQRCLAGEQPAAATGQFGGEFLLVLLGGDVYRLFCKVADLKSLLIRLFLRVNVKGHLFHQETPELTGWQWAG